MQTIFQVEQRTKNGCINLCKSVCWFVGKTIKIRSIGSIGLVHVCRQQAQGFNLAFRSASQSIKRISTEKLKLHNCLQTSWLILQTYFQVQERLKLFVGLQSSKFKSEISISLITVWCNIWFGIHWWAGLLVKWLLLHIRRVNIDREAFNLQGVLWSYYSNYFINLYKFLGNRIWN